MVQRDVSTTFTGTTRSSAVRPRLAMIGRGIAAEPPAEYDVRRVELGTGRLARHKLTLGLRELDVHLIHSDADDAWTTVRVGHRLRIPTVVTFEPSHLRVADARWGRVFGHAAASIATSPAVATRLAEIGCPRERIHLVPSGVDCDWFRPDDTVARDKGLLVVGPLTEATGIIPLFKALTLIRSRTGYCPAVTVVGTGEQRPLLDTMVRRLRLPVEFVTAPSPLELRSLMHRHTALVIPEQTIPDALARGLVGTVREAQASGLPVVVTDVDGAADAVVQNIDGLVVPERDSHALALGVERLLHEPDLQTSLRVGGLTSARAVDCAVHTAAIDRVYRRVLGRPLAFDAPLRRSVAHPDSEQNH